jgi:formamidopyrimidine-DNA glycosylase
MPEGPEITILSQYLLTKLKGRNIENIEVLSGKYKRKNMTNINLLQNHKYEIKNIESKGKLMWITLKNIVDNKIIYLTSHLGLSGEWGFQKNDNDRVRLTIGNNDNDTKYMLCFNDDRNFGNLEIYDNKDDLDTKINALAPDALKTEFTNDEFIEMVKKYLKVSSKRGDQLIFKVLMNQTKKDGIVSGLGNYLAPEILYNAKISPFRKMNSLNTNDLLNLAHSIKFLIKLSYYNNATGYMSNFGDFVEKHKNGVDSGKYPNYHPDIILKKNIIFEFKVYRLDKDPHGNIVEKDKTINAGRTTHWVPAVQL